MKRLPVVAFAAALVSLVSSSLVGAQPSAMPAVGAIAPGRTVLRRDTVLADGVHVTLAHVGASPKALVRVVLATGAEPASVCGATAALAHAMEGVGLGDSIGHMGGQLVTLARAERVELTVEVLSAFAPVAVDLVAGLVRAPDSGAARAIPTSSGSADSVAMEALRQAFFPAGQFGSTCPAGGEPSEGRAADVERFYRARVGPTATRVLVVGRFDDRDVLREVDRAFGDWPRDRVVSDSGGVTAGAAPPLIIVHRAGVRQSAIVIGAAVPGAADSDFAALRVMDVLLGGNVASRITVNIREAKGYAYGPGSVLVAAPSGAAYWAELADVSTPVTWPAIREILAEIARLGASEPDSAELEGSRRYLLGRTLVQTATRRGWAEHDHLVALMSRRGAASDGAGDRLLAVSRGDIRRVTAAYLVARRLTIVVVGDTVAIGEQLGAIRQAARALRGE